MKKATLLLATGVVAAAGFVSALASEPADHKMLTPQEVKWAPGPASLPPGTEAAVLYGDPTKEGLFAMRLKLPKGYRIAPHTHPKPEIVTVISGTFRLGLGEKADDGKAKAMPAGSFLALSPGTPHFAAAEQDVVIQLNSTGPWALTYINPSDDPRHKTN
jgi:quercetin dioxygenase-like cupin family protein